LLCNKVFGNFRRSYGRDSHGEGLGGEYAVGLLPAGVDGLSGAGKETIGNLVRIYVKESIEAMT